MASKVPPKDIPRLLGLSRAERAELRQDRTKALARIAEIDMELEGVSDKGWQQRKATGLRREMLRAEKEVLVARLKLSTKGTALDQTSQKLVERLEKKMT